MDEGSKDSFCYVKLEGYIENIFKCLISYRKKICELIFIFIWFVINMRKVKNIRKGIGLVV